MPTLLLHSLAKDVHQPQTTRWSKALLLEQTKICWVDWTLSPKDIECFVYSFYWWAERSFEGELNIKISWCVNLHVFFFSYRIKLYLLCIVCIVCESVCVYALIYNCNQELSELSWTKRITQLEQCVSSTFVFVYRKMKIELYSSHRNKINLSFYAICTSIYL